MAVRKLSENCFSSNSFDALITGKFNLILYLLSNQLYNLSKGSLTKRLTTGNNCGYLTTKAKNL